MIKDELKNYKIYVNLSDNLKKGFDWLVNTNLDNIEDGRYEIDAEKVYACVQTYETKDFAKYESHRKYIDIQYMIFGKEKIGVTNLSNCITCIEYDKERDLEFYNIKSEDEYCRLEEGQFMIFYPHDAHKPSIMLDKKSIVKKVVVKVRLEQD